VKRNNQNNSINKETDKHARKQVEFKQRQFLKHKTSAIKQRIRKVNY